MKRLALEQIPRQELAIPPGWSVVHHAFFALDPDAEVEVEGLPGNDPHELLVQDLVQLYHEASDTTLDIGWYPEADPVGRYELELVVDGRWDEPLVHFSTRSRAEMVAEINRILARQDQGNPLK